MALICWFPLNNTAKNNGASGVTLAGSPASWTGLGAKFTGDVKKVLYDNTADNLYYTDDFSFSVWLKTNYTGTTSQFAFTVGRADYATYGYGIQILSTSNINVWYGNASRSVSCPGGEWHHIVMSVHNKVATLYKDGVEVGKITPSAMATYEDAKGIGIGCFHYSGDIYPYYGEIRDLRIYDNPISAREVKELSKGLVAEWTLANAFGSGRKNLFQNSGWFVGSHNSGSVSDYDKSFNGFTVTSAKTTSSWGSGFSCVNGNLTVPYGESYTISMDVLVPSQHTIVVDFNNSPVSGDAWSGNDNDDMASRSSSNFIIQANKWTRIWWSTRNSNAKNTSKLALNIWDSVGLRTSDDSGPVTWKIKDVKAELGSDYSGYSLPDNGSTVISDVSGFNNHGTVTGTLKLDSDSPRYGASMLSDQDTAKGNGNHFIHATTPFNALEQYTITGWVKQKAGGGYSTIIANNRSLGGSGLWLAVNTGNCGLWAYNNMYCKGHAFLEKNEWYHFAFLFNKGKVIWYLNGDPVAESDWTSRGTITDMSNIYIFDPYPSTGWDTHFVGNLSDIRIYATNLSRKDIVSLCNTPITLSDSGALMTQGEYVEDE